MNDPQEPAVAGVLRDESLAGQLGITATAIFILLVAGQYPISADQRTLSRLLNSPVVQSKLAQAIQPAPIVRPNVSDMAW